MNSPVRIALLGCGGFMGAHAQRLLKNPDAQVVALCDTTPQIVESFAAKFYEQSPIKPAAFTDPAAMYRDAKPDAVFIATPHTLHYQHAVQALDAGLHVFIEKPMVTSAPDAYALKAKADAAGKIVVVGYNSSCTAELQFIRDAIRTRKFGKLELVVGYLAQDWRRLTIGLWRQNPALSGGGQAYDSGAHLLNSLVWSVESNVEQVFAFVDNVGTPVDINSSINVRFQNGVMASIVVGGNSPGGGSHMVFIFDQGRIDVDGWSGSWMNVFDAKGHKVKYPHVPYKDQTPDDNFIDAVLGRAQPATSPTNGIVQSELMDAIYESARTGLPVKPKRR